MFTFVTEMSALDATLVVFVLCRVKAIGYCFRNAFGTFFLKKKIK